MSELSDADHEFLCGMTRQHQATMRAEMGEYVSQRKLDRERLLDEYPGESRKEEKEEGYEL